MTPSSDHMDGRLPGNIVPWQRLLHVSRQRFLAALADDSQAFGAYDALEEMGAKGLEFGDVLIEHLLSKQFSTSLFRAAVSVLRHDPKYIKKLIASFLSMPSPYPYPGILSSVICSLGSECLAVDPLLPETLLEGTHSTDEYKVVGCVVALGGVTRGTDIAVARLIELTTHPRDIVQGVAIRALGDVRYCPRWVVPHLAKLMDSFEEYDPDTAYYGKQSRIADALGEYGSDAAIALPQILAHLQPPPDDRDSEIELDESILRLLTNIGPAAREELPVLEMWRSRLKAAGDEFNLEDLDRAICAIKGIDVATRE